MVGKGEAVGRSRVPALLVFPLLHSGCIVDAARRWFACCSLFLSFSPLARCTAAILQAGREESSLQPACQLLCLHVRTLSRQESIARERQAGRKNRAAANVNNSDSRSTGDRRTHTHERRVYEGPIRSDGSERRKEREMRV